MKVSRAATAAARSFRLPEGSRVQILAPIVRGRKGIYKKELREAARTGFVRARVDGEVRDLADEIDRGPLFADFGSHQAHRLRCELLIQVLPRDGGVLGPTRVTGGKAQAQDHDGQTG